MKHIAFLAVLLLLGGAGCSLKNTTTLDTTTDTPDAVVREENTVSPKDTMMDENSEVSIDSGTYVIASGESRYVAQKEFFGKPTLDVTGTTPDIAGTIVVDTDAQTVSVDAIIENTFNTDSGARDSDVRKLLGGSVSVQGENLTFSSLQKGSVLLSLTIGEVTREIPFTVTVSLNDPLTASGHASFNVSDFGLEPPSLLNVFTVHNTIGVQFDIQSVTKQ